MGEVKLTDDPRVLGLLQVLADHRGVLETWDDTRCPMRAYYDDRGANTDTYNLAIEGGLIFWSHDSDGDTSTSRLTPAGRSALQQKGGPE